MVQHNYWICRDYEKALLFSNYEAWEKMVKRCGYSLLPGWRPDGVRYLTMQEYAREVA